jgi:GTP-binding protein EngB required for normal cell division
LQLAIILVDANVPAQASDRRLIDFLQSAGRDLLIVATKTDKLSANKLRPALARLRREHGVDGVLAYSSKTGAGRADLWRAIRARMAK